MEQQSSRDYNLEEKYNYRRLVTPYRNRQEPVHRWLVFQHSYSRELVSNIIFELGADHMKKVLDPFCGSGTTMLSCKELGISAVGVDRLPLSVFSSNVKLRDYPDDGVIEEELTKLRNGDGRPLGYPGSMDWGFPDIRIIQSLFSPDVEREIISLKWKINEISDRDIRDLLLLGLISILETFSYSIKDGAFLRRVSDKKIPDEGVTEHFRSRIKSMVEDIQRFNSSLKLVERSNDSFWSAIEGDARILPFKSNYFDYVITSPPYLNRHDYTRVYVMELALHFVKSFEELKKLRYGSLRSHVEARPTGLDSDGYMIPNRLSGIMDDLRKRALNNDKIIPMIKGYFEDIYLSLKELHRVTKEGGKVVFVIGNVRYSGVMIPVDMIVAEIGEQVGFKCDKIWIARRKGNSPQQMREFKKELARESLVFWTK